MNQASRRLWLIGISIVLVAFVIISGIVRTELRYSCAKTREKCTLVQWSVWGLIIRPAKLIQENNFSNCPDWWLYSTYYEYGPWGCWGTSVSCQPTEFRPDEPRGGTGVIFDSRPKGEPVFVL